MPVKKYGSKASRQKTGSLGLKPLGLSESERTFMPKKTVPGVSSKRAAIVIKVEHLARSFGLSKGQIAETAGLSRETLYRSSRAAAPKTQARLKEMLEIVSRVSTWAGGKDQAMAWYRAEPLPEFGGRTAESLVKDGQAAAVRDYLDHVALGGFA